MPQRNAPVSDGHVVTGGAQVGVLTPNGNGGFTTNDDVGARMLESGLSIAGFRTADVLQKDEWLQFDTRVVQVAQERLVGIVDLFERNLVINVSNALGTTVYQWQDMSDMTPANISMEGVTPAQQDRVTFDLNSIPLPIVHKDFQISKRVLEASRRLGDPLDTTQAAVATRLVSEKVEDMLFNGASSLTFGGGTLRGYLDHPDRNTVTLAQNWDASGKTGEEMLADIIAMISAANADFMFGPYVVYITGAYWTQLQEDFKTNSDRTILERLMAVAGISAIKPADVLPANTVVMVQMSSDTISVINGMQPTLLQWETHGGMMAHFKVMAILPVRIASDHLGNNGIVHLS